MRPALVGVALAVVTLTGQPALADGTSGAYGFASDDQPVTGASTTADAQLLVPGRTYKSSLPADSDVSYRLDLDATSNAYVSVTAVPRAGTLVTATDGIRVTVRDADSRSCSVESAYVGPSRSPRPVVAWGSRETAARRTSCQGEGRYYVVVHRIAGTSSTPDDWDLELAPFLEPRLEKAVGTTPTGSTGSTGSSGSSGSSDSGSLDPLTGPAVPRSGGSGFGAAAAVEQGVWSVDISPGQTLFYAVPVGWGQRIGATAELGSTRRGGYMGGALNMALYNPARGPVDDVNLGYSGSQKSASLGSLPPVDYANRYASLGSVSGTRFAGTYYLALHLAEGMGEEYGTGPYEVTLRVRVEGTAEAGPTYDGRFEPPGPFEAAAGPGRGAAGGGEGGDGVAGNDGNDAVMTVVAAAGLGGGTLVLAALGVWTAVARRRAGGAW